MMKYTVTWFCCVALVVAAGCDQNKNANNAVQQGKRIEQGNSIGIGKKQVKWLVDDEKEIIELISDEDGSNAFGLTAHGWEALTLLIDKKNREICSFSLTGSGVWRQCHLKQ